MHKKTSFILVAILVFVFATSCTSDESGEVVEREQKAMSESEQSFLDLATGSYRGPNLLWFQDPNKPEESVSDVHVTSNEINYTWQFRGKPQTGRMVFKLEGKAVEVDWVDSWHAAEGFKCTGAHSHRGMNFLCHYGVDGKAQWGWRTELSMPNADQFLVEMFNITPEGQEQIAVRITADRMNP